jgi:hypothetical protein
MLKKFDRDLKLLAISIGASIAISVSTLVFMNMMFL